MLPEIDYVQRNGDFQTIYFTDGSSVYTSSEQDENGDWRDGRGIDAVLTLADTVRREAGTVEVARSAALTAVSRLLSGIEQNVLSQALMWQAVNVAIDAYDDEWMTWLYADPTVGYAVSLDGLTLEVAPTKRMARAIRRTLANRDRRKRLDYRITAVTVYRP